MSHWLSLFLEIRQTLGRPWWYDSYWEKGRRPRKRFQLPRRQLWLWIALIALSLFLAGRGAGFSQTGIVWLFSFVYYLCHLLALAVFLRAILSWFPISRFTLPAALLDDITDPVLAPLRRVVPRLGTLDITPIVAIAALYLIPSLLRGLSA